MLFAFILYVGAFAPLAQAATAATPTDHKAPLTCTVSGRVVSAADASPLKSARIALVSERDEQASPKGFTAMSDGDGRFTLKDVPAGRYQFFASHAAYVTKQYQSKGTDKGAPLALHPGDEIKDVLFRMTLAAVVTGRVTDEDGEPMERIQVVALHRPTEDELEDNSWLQHMELTPAAAGQTDDRGEFRLFGLKPGEYFIRAEDEYVPNNALPLSNESTLRQSLGSQYAPVYYPGVTQMGQAQAVSATSGAEVEADFILRHSRMVEISGKVIGFDGTPPGDADVMLVEAQPSDFNFNHETSVNKNGQFKLTGVPAGSYVVIADQRSSADGSGYRAQQKIEVGDDNVDSVTLVLGRGTKVSGHVNVSGSTIKPETLFISLQPLDLDFSWTWANVKKDGSFEMLDVAEGTFTINLHGLKDDYFVQSAREGREDILANGLRVSKEQGVAAIQIQVGKASAKLEGTVLQDGGPLIGAHVRLTPAPETAYNKNLGKSANTDQTGHFSFAALGPGKYKVVAKASFKDGGKQAVSEAKVVTLSENEMKNQDLTVVPPDDR